ncbi:conserved hypothetical protein, membrane [Candidatus Magnetomorum sp. HK-1]|nr:conserved hypothetical protein, membrane [Candidatus Magnetomorum sp. HK-1]
MNKYSFVIVFILVSLIVPFAYSEEPVIERLIRVEESIKNLELRLNESIKNLDLRLNDTNKQIEYLRNDISSLRNAIYQTFFFAIIAIIIWDRRSTLKPVWDKIDDLEKRFK